MIHSFAESEIQRVGRGDVVKRQHLKSFEDRQRNFARKMARGGVERRGYRATPLQSQRFGYFIFAGKAEFFYPLPDFSVVSAALSFERGAHFNISKLAARYH